MQQIRQVAAIRAVITHAHGGKHTRALTMKRTHDVVKHPKHLSHRGLCTRACWVNEVVCLLRGHTSLFCCCWLFVVERNTVLDLHGHGSCDDHVPSRGCAPLFRPQRIIPCGISARHFTGGSWRWGSPARQGGCMHAQLNCPQHYHSTQRTRRSARGSGAWHAGMARACMHTRTSPPLWHVTTSVVHYAAPGRARRKSALPNPPATVHSRTHTVLCRTPRPAPAARACACAARVCKRDTRLTHTPYIETHTPHMTTAVCTTMNGWMDE
jgi:hypothetical protein